MKNQIYELYGHLINDNSEESLKNRKECKCPFYDGLCDGGGNRYQTFLSKRDLERNKLDDYFDSELDLIPPGVCSLIAKDTKWIVCPRRVFSFDQNGGRNYHYSLVSGIIRQFCDLIENEKIAIWAEAKVKYSETNDDDDTKSFDYTFDYVVASVAPKRIDAIAKELGISERKLQSSLEKTGQILSSRNGSIYMENYPVGKLNIVEIMTSSTSGGNKNKGTTIQQSFINAIKGNEHESPGINYRQVWARMVSQLIVKSQIGSSWGSKTLWIVQDALANYISGSTDLNLQKLISQFSKEVNIVSLKYTEEKDKLGCLKLEVDNLYAGEIPKITGDTDFNKLLQASVIPEMDMVKSKLLFKKPKAIIE